MGRIASAVVAVFFILFASSAPAGAITNGQPDGGWHPYVGMLTDGYTLCSGTLIAPKVVLTAAHCINDFGGSGKTQSVMVSFAAENDFGNFVFDTTSSAMYTEPLGYDVGVVLLKNPVKIGAFGYLPAEGSVDWLGNKTPLTAVGYGFTGFAPNGGPPEAVGGGTRLYATTEFINDNHNYAPQFMKLSTNPAQDKGGTCFGDSGGPIFADDQVTILGISSWGGSNCNSLSYAQRMDLPDVLNWVYGFL